MDSYYATFLFFDFFFEKQIYTKVQSTVITEINKYIQKSKQTNKKTCKQKAVQEKQKIPIDLKCLA